MKESNKTRTFDEVLKSALLRQKTLRQRFKISLPAENLLPVITAAYVAEVEYRGHKFTNDEAVNANLKTFVDTLTGENGKCGIVICGLCGNGKTTLLYAFQNAINLLSKERFTNYPGMRIVDARRIVSDYKNASEFKAVCNADLLGIEDLGREPTEIVDFGNIFTPVIELLEHRYDKQLFTVITTNLTPKELSEKYGERIADRFRETMKVIVFENPSYRAL